ncbi:MAG: YraN family protein [Firmicutes bacterium]|nr:YraN family protein [Bacillota bacterium]
MKESKNRSNSNSSIRDQRRKEMGRLGEEMAALMLQDQDYEIICRNYRCRFGEIDIVAMKKGVLTFIEVKSRTGTAFGEPAEAVTWSKQQKLRQTALQFLNEYEGTFVGVEFQVVEVLLRHHDGLDF